MDWDRLGRKREVVFGKCPTILEVHLSSALSLQWGEVNPRHGNKIVGPASGNTVNRGYEYKLAIRIDASDFYDRNKRTQADRRKLRPPTSNGVAGYRSGCHGRHCGLGAA